MPRNLDPNSLITLPNLTANEAHTLAQQLEAAALDEHGKPRKLPEAAKEALDAVREDRVALLAALGGPAADSAGVKDADLREDRAVRALNAIIEGWAILGGVIPQGDAAADLDARLFSTGIAFINLSPREEWTEVESRLDTIDREGLGPQLQSLGLGPVIAHLRDVHEAYGKATGATAARPARETAQIRAKLNALTGEIRHYVTAVLGSVQKSKPQTRALADLLLAPLAAWESAPRARKKDAPPAPVTPPNG